MSNEEEEIENLIKQEISFNYNKLNDSYGNQKYHFRMTIFLAIQTQN